MGEGLYYDPDGITAYAQPWDDDAPSDEYPDDRLFRWEDFEREVLSLLPTSWSPVEWAWKDRARILAQNGLHVLTLYQDSYSRAHLTVAIRTDRDASREALAKAQLIATASRFFDALHFAYPLRVRTSAWTSEAYQPSTERRAA